MITKKVLVANRIRRIDGGFSFIPHRFLTDGFLEDLGQQQLLLYIFLVLAADRYGLSFYSYDRGKYQASGIMIIMTETDHATARAPHLRCHCPWGDEWRGIESVRKPLLRGA